MNTEQLVRHISWLDTHMHLV